jgi:hypothetical protein
MIEPVIYREGLMSGHFCLLRLTMKKTAGKQKRQKRAKRAKRLLFALLARFCSFCLPLLFT